MNPFYSYSHNHLSQFSNTNNEIPSPSLTPISSSSHQHLQQQNQVQQHLQQQSPPQTQFLQTSPTTQSSAASVAAAAAFFRNSAGQEYQSRRHMTNMNSNISNNSVNSLASNSTPWKNNCLMDNFKFEPNTNTLFGGFDDNLIHIAKQDNLYMAAAAAAANHPSNISGHHLHSMNPTRHSFENGNNNSLNEIGDRNLHHQHHHLNQPNSSSISDTTNVNANPFYNAFYNAHHHQSISPPSSHQLSQHSAAAIAAAAANAIGQTDVEVDPRELESFAERFKQRRIKLGVTQADVGQQLSKLKLPGVGSLSQSTICRFESLTLSHNNMIALKPVLHSWLEQAENDSRMKRKSDEVMSTSSTMTNVSSASLTSMTSSCNGINQNSNGAQNTNGMITNGSNNNNANSGHNASSMLMNNSSSNSSASGGSGMSQSQHDRKRKRTSIAAPEKRSLEAFFNVQPRPSGEKIAQIAEKLELKKNVVRVWFCNQRQKQKRMKFNAVQNR